MSGRRWSGVSLLTLLNFMVYKQQWYYDYKNCWTLVRTYLCPRNVLALSNSLNLVRRMIAGYKISLMYISIFVDDLKIYSSAKVTRRWLYNKSVHLHLTISVIFLISHSIQSGNASKREADDERFAMLDHSNLSSSSLVNLERKLIAVTLAVSGCPVLCSRWWISYYQKTRRDVRYKWFTVAPPQSCSIQSKLRRCMRYSTVLNLGWSRWTNDYSEWNKISTSSITIKHKCRCLKLTRNIRRKLLQSQRSNIQIIDAQVKVILQPTQQL